MQARLSPVALVSGVGLLILLFSKRLGRVMNRLRALVLVQFSMTVCGRRLETLVLGLIASNILSLIGSLALFILDSNQPLRAVEQELALEPRATSSASSRSLSCR